MIVLHMIPGKIPQEILIVPGNVDNKLMVLFGLCKVIVKNGGKKMLQQPLLMISALRASTRSLGFLMGYIQVTQCRNYWTESLCSQQATTTLHTVDLHCGGKQTICTKLWEKWCKSISIATSLLRIAARHGFLREKLLLTIDVFYKVTK